MKVAQAQWNLPNWVDLLVISFVAGQPELADLEDAIRHEAAELPPPPGPAEVDTSAMRGLEATLAEAKAVIEKVRSAEQSAITWGPAAAVAAPDALAQLEERRQASDEALRWRQHLPELQRALAFARQEWGQQQDQAQRALERQRRAELAVQLRELDAKLGEAVANLLPRILALQQAMSGLAT